MRPRHYAADNLALGISFRCAYRASMRPRHYAADNPGYHQRNLAKPHRASMRPRHYAADNINSDEIQDIRAFGFNEAAALRRG